MRFADVSSYHINMNVERYEHRHLQIVCELNDSAAASRAAEWADVKEQAIATESLPNGVRVWLPAQSAELARDIARREAQCCGFLDIEVRTDDDKVRFDITSAVPGAVQLIEFLSGSPSELRP